MFCNARLHITLIVLCLTSSMLSSQIDTFYIGFGNHLDSVSVTSSDNNSNSDHTLTTAGFLPNLSGSSRFLSRSTLGYNFEEIELVNQIGYEDWIDDQLEIDTAFSLLNKAMEYHQYRVDSIANTGGNISNNDRFFDYAWWQYHMTSPDYIRQRVAFALSQILVISRFSDFANNSYAFGSYYDMLLEHSFGNYRELLSDVTYQPAMGVYLTYLNNPKSDVLANQFPDENYARELMQLFTIGLYKLNMDGTVILDNEGNPVPTYDNTDIAEFSKIFTGLSWGDRDDFDRNRLSDTSYTYQMQMFNDFHEPGDKILLDGYVLNDRVPVDGIADIEEALDHLFSHQNLAPFLTKFMIQRLVTSNPSPEYVERVATIFNDNGNGIKGDMKAFIKAILLDDEARECGLSQINDYGKMREPFIRYTHMNKAFDISTLSGNHRNDMDYVFRYVGQKPFTSPSVFNFYQYDYQPIGLIEQQDKFAPEFQITNSQTITGYINGLYRWIISENPADEYDLFSDEFNSAYEDEIATWDISDEILLATDDKLHMLMDRLNLLFAGGKINTNSIQTIIDVVKTYPAEDDDDKSFRVRLATYLLLSSPDYIINR